jgi:hypothetical protein
MRLERRFLKEPKNTESGKRQFNPVVTRIIIGRVDIAMLLLMGRSAIESESDEDIAEDSILAK